MVWELTTETVFLTGLTEDMAWPARPQDTYGLEKLYAEEMCLAYAKDFPIKTRIARYHNVYGPRGTWKGNFLQLKEFLYFDNAF
jgi:nucleoside-diphosphate-sugar epimerase